VDLITAIQQSAVTEFVRGTLWIYPTMLTLHAVGLAFAVGIGVTLDLRVLGIASGLPLSGMRRLVPLFYLALGVNALSGVVLVLNDPARWLVDPLFYTKLALLALAVFTVVWTDRRLARPALPPLRAVAIVSLVCWTGALTAGRLLAYPFFR